MKHVLCGDTPIASPRRNEPPQHSGTAGRLGLTVYSSCDNTVFVGIVVVSAWFSSPFGPSMRRTEQAVPVLEILRGLHLPAHALVT